MSIGACWHGSRDAPSRPRRQCRIGRPSSRSSRRLPRASQPEPPCRCPEKTASARWRWRKPATAPRARDGRCRWRSHLGKPGLSVTVRRETVKTPGETGAWSRKGGRHTLLWYADQLRGETAGWSGVSAVAVEVLTDDPG